MKKQWTSKFRKSDETIGFLGPKNLFPENFRLKSPFRGKLWQILYIWGHFGPILGVDDVISNPKLQNIFSIYSVNVLFSCLHSNYNTIIRETYHSFFIKYVYIYMTRQKLSYIFPTLFTNLTTIIIKINSNGRKNSNVS